MSKQALIVHILSQSRSLYSTRRLFEESLKRGHRVKVYPSLNLSMLIDKNETELFFLKEKLKCPQVVIPRIGQKKAAYTLAVLRQIETMGAKSLNSSQAFRKSRDKLLTMQILAQKNIGIARTFFLDTPQDVGLAIEMVGGAPLIIKLTEGTQGFGVMLAETERSARSILEGLLNQGQHVLVQEFVAESEGSDIRAIVLNGQIIAAMKRTSIGDEFRSNVHRGGTQKAVDIKAELSQTAKVSARALGLDFAGVDLILSNRGPLVLEVNPSPGLEGIENSTGINIAEKCIDFLENSFS